ncbi:hypothetical protein ACFLTM_05870 [Candidatus Bipolaricaulota bacterium]
MAIVREHQQGAIQFGSPVADHLRKGLTEGAQGEEEGESDEEESERPSSDAEIVDGAGVPAETDEEEGGFLDFVLESERSAVEITGFVEELTTGMSTLGASTQQHTIEIESLGDGSAQGSAVRANQIAQSIAQDMTQYASLVRDRLPKLEFATEKFFSSSTSHVEWLASNPEDSTRALVKLRTNAAGLLEATGTAIAGIRSYREAVVGLRKARISRSVGRAAGLLTNATNQLIGGFEKIEALSSKLIGDIDAIAVQE